MLTRTLRGLCSAALTDATATHSAGTRNLRRPKAALEQQLKHRRRQRVVQRRKSIANKEAEVKRAVEGVTSSRDLVLAQLADQIFAKGHRHVASAANVGFVPDGNPATPLVALAGRELCGKTSLLRSLFRSPREVGRSNRQLRRDAMNFFNVGGVFNVADLPGCGATSVPWTAVLQHAVLLRNFARCQPSLKMLYYCMDVHYKHGLYVQDIDVLRFLAREVPNFIIVLTKADQISDATQQTAHLQDIRKELIYQDIHHPVLVTSAFHMGGVDTLRYDMVMNCLHSLPTERLTLTEAQRLSARLFSQKELSTIRPLAIAPTQVDDEVREWAATLEATERDAAVHNGDLGEARGNLDEGTGEVDEASEEELHYSDAEAAAFADEDGELGAANGAAAHITHALPSSASPLPLSEDASWRSPEAPSTSPSEESVAVQRLAALATMTSAVPAVFHDPVTQLAYERVVKTLRNRPLLQYVETTSPWRNPLRWPRHVVPTKHPKANIMRCPEAPENPYLFQAQYVAPRADLCFRRPNVGARKASHKGKYEADKPLAFLVKEYTIPYFPDIVDTAMQPLPWTFLGSREAYYERGGGRRLGVRLLNYATAGAINPLSDNPAPNQPALTKELQALEAKRYGAPIAMLRPPEDATEKKCELPAPSPAADSPPCA